MYVSRWLKVVGLTRAGYHGVVDEVVVKKDSLHGHWAWKKDGGVGGEKTMPSEVSVEKGDDGEGS